MTGVAIRRAMLGDAAACAAIKNAWIDETDWMPRVHSADELLQHYRETVFPNRRLLVAGDPVRGFGALDEGAGEVTSLFVADRGHGIGNTILDVFKNGRMFLEAWTFVANEGARRFYAREGFSEVRRTDGENEEGLADVLLRWERVT